MRVYSWSIKRGLAFKGSKYSVYDRSVQTKKGTCARERKNVTRCANLNIRSMPRAAFRTRPNLSRTDDRNPRYVFEEAGSTKFQTVGPRSGARKTDLPVLPEGVDRISAAPFRSHGHVRQELIDSSEERIPPILSSISLARASAVLTALKKYVRASLRPRDRA